MFVSLLPAFQGVPVMGACSESVTISDSDGNYVIKHDPGLDGPITVAVLLGRMPGCEVRPMLYWGVSTGNQYLNCQLFSWLLNTCQQHANLSTTG
jgi:hypothetical protein